MHRLPRITLCSVPFIAFIEKQGTRRWWSYNNNNNDNDNDNDNNDYSSMPIQKNKNHRLKMTITLMMMKRKNTYKKLKEKCNTVMNLLCTIICSTFIQQPYNIHTPY